MRLPVAAAAIVLVLGAEAWAANVVVGNHVLMPNMANQVVSIYVSGGEAVAGEDFFAQVGDGGTFNGGVNTKPALANVDIITGSIFDGNNNGAFGDSGNGSTHPLIWVDGTTTSTGTVAADGRLAKLTLDTTGLASGTFPLLLSGVASSRGTFNSSLRNASGALVPLSITNGSLFVAVPTAGDFNLDGTVDTADYVAWRNGLGTVFTSGDYDTWRAHYGQSLGGGSAANSSATIPEPVACFLVLVGVLLSAGAVRRRAL
jgi:hypothetical protein